MQVDIVVICPCYKNWGVLDMEDVTGYLFLHGHILNQQSPDTIGNSMRAFPGFPPWTKSWSARSKTSQTDCGVYFVLPLPLDTKGNAGISCPHI